VSSTATAWGPGLSSEDHTQIKGFGFVVYGNIYTQKLEQYPTIGYNCLTPKSYLTTIHYHLSILLEAI